MLAMFGVGTTNSRENQQEKKSSLHGWNLVSPELQLQTASTDQTRKRKLNFELPVKDLEVVSIFKMKNGFKRNIV